MSNEKEQDNNLGGEEAPKVSSYIGGYKKPVMSVGEEFIAWAEQYWALEQRYAETVKDHKGKHDENCPYSVVKQAFQNKINDIITNRFINYL